MLEAVRNLSKRQLYFLVPVAFFVVAFVGRTLFYYQGFYFAPNVPTSEPERVQALSEPDQAVPVIGDGNQVVLIDNSHLNKFSEEEMTTLFGRITAAGGRVEVILPLHDEELEERLRGASAFVVLANQEFYEQNELVLLDDFVNRGGRLLIVGDPTRVTFMNALNSLAGHFGIIYEDDYIYNLVENDGNYLNVILHEFADSPLTEGIEQIVVRSAGSMRVAEGGLIFGDGNTYSSLREQPGEVTAAAITTNGNVLALPDLTFLTGPYNTFADNDHFIDNVVGFLLGGQRSFEVLDFPNYFDETVELVYPDSGLLEASFSISSQLRQALEDAGVTPHQDDNLLPGDQAIVVAAFDGLDRALRDLLISDGVRVNSVGDLVVLRDVGELTRTGAVLFHLQQDDEGQYQLFILADDAEALERGITLLLEGGLEVCTLRPATAFCSPDILATPTPTPTETRTPFVAGTAEESGESTPEGDEATPTATPEP